MIGGNDGNHDDDDDNGPSPPEDWSPCPSDDLNFRGHRASYDCTSYVECSGGMPQGSYVSCLGLKFDNERGVCDWAESVACASDGGDDNNDDDGSDNGSVGEEGEVENTQGGGGDDNNNNNNKDDEVLIIGSITDYDTDRTNSAGSSGAEANNEVTGWQGGSDWGGSWIDGVWYVPFGLFAFLLACLLPRVQRGADATGALCSLYQSLAFRSYFSTNIIL